jgi:hypothetical protein
MSNKRKHQHIVAGELESLVERVTPSTSQQDLFKIVSQVKALITVTKIPKVENRTIAASTIQDLDQVIHLTGIKCLYGSEAHNWSLRDDPDKAAEIQHACPWLGMRVDIVL